MVTSYLVDLVGGIIEWSLLGPSQYVHFSIHALILVNHKVECQLSQKRF